MDLFLCGDVMTGRGIDQILPNPSEPTIYEPALTSAEEYVELAERASGHIPRPVDFAYVWGDALDELESRRPDLRLINLETAVTTSEARFPKGINYRMHPANIGCLLAAGIDCCNLANNHMLDWGTAGLLETISTLSAAGSKAAGAGRTAEEAMRPAVLTTASGARVLVFGFGLTTSGIPSNWAATAKRLGVNLLPDLSQETARRIATHVQSLRQPGDIVIASIHWGDNWGYDIPESQSRFAHQLVDSGCADIIHGHSSHHFKGIEVYGGRLVLYGCGDFITDYEGIAGHEEYRPELALGYFARIGDSGRLEGLDMVPFRSQRFRLQRVGKADAAWIARVLNREGQALGTSFELRDDSSLTLASFAA